MSNVQNNNTNTENQKSLLKNAAGLQPTGAMFTINGSVIEEWLYQVLTTKFHIDGIEAVRVHAARIGQRPEIDVYVFLNTRSKNLKSNTYGVPEHLRKKMDEGVYTPDDSLKKSLIPFTDKFKLSSARGKVLCKLNIFKVLGGLLLLNPRSEQLNIVDVAKEKNNVVFSVFKSTKFVTEDNGKGDVYSSIINQMR